jgi:hypothetical protein
MELSLYVFGDHAHPIIDDLEESATNLESTGGPALPDRQHSLAEQGHERGMVRQDADLAVERGRNDCVRLSIEYRRFRRDNGDLHHDPASFFAFSTASSIPPTM